MAPGKRLSQREIKRFEIHVLRDQGFSKTEVMKRVGVAWNTVVLHWPRETGDTGHRTNATPRKLTPAIISEIERVGVGMNLSSCARVASQVSQTMGGGSISKSTVSTVLRKNHKNVSVPRGPLLTDGRKAERVIKAIAFGRKAPTLICYRDESHFQRYLAVNCRLNRRWVKRNSVVRLSTPTGKGFSFSVWGAIGHNYKSDLYFIAGRNNSESYISLLEQEVDRIKEEDVGGRNMLTSKYFMQDGARIHWSKYTLENLERLGVNHLGKGTWPPYSPDLNPIECVWGIMKNRMAGIDFASREELEIAIRKAWNDVHQSTINKLCYRQARRFQDCWMGDGEKVS